MPGAQKKFKSQPVPESWMLVVASVNSRICFLSLVAQQVTALALNAMSVSWNMRSDLKVQRLNSEQGMP
jgi:hypothetical protein